MARQAEAERNGRARHQRRGRVQAAERIYDASEIISRSPSALQLRCLHTLTDLGVNQNATEVFPLPLEILRGLSARATLAVTARRARPCAPRLRWVPLPMEHATTSRHARVRRQPGGDPMTKPSSPDPLPGPQRRAGGSEPLVDAIGDYMARRQPEELGSAERGATAERSPRGLRRARRATMGLCGAAIVLLLLIVLIML